MTPEKKKKEQTQFVKIYQSETHRHYYQYLSTLFFCKTIILIGKNQTLKYILGK